MTALRLFARAVAIGATVLVALGAYWDARLRAGPLDAAGLETLRGEALAALLARLGATFVKLGQVLGSRPDLIPPGIARALATLHDRVPPGPFADVRRVLDAELGTALDAVAHIDEVPLAAASVAQVHRAVTRDGAELALKVQRPGARAQIERDLAILALAVRLLDRIPSVHLLSLPGAVARLDESLRGQLDFRSEAENNRRFTESFRGVAGIAFPRIEPSLSTGRVLAMELVHGVRGGDVARVHGDKQRLARVGAEAVLKMVFADGFVHADMHPGNVFYDGDRIVLIDLGMVATIPPEMLRPWAETFAALAARDGRTLARLFYEHAPTVATTDYAAFEHDVVTHFAALYGKSLGDVEVGDAIGGSMNVLRRHGVQVDPVFTVVHVALLVAEGLGKQLDPTLDLVALAMPYLARAIAEAPPGRAPRRHAPG